MRTLIVCFLAVGAIAVGTPASALDPPPAGLDPLIRRVLTQDGTGMYEISQSAYVVTMRAPAGVGNNQREVFWPTSGEASLNARSCATWAFDSTFGAAPGEPMLQQGLAVRIHSANGRTRALTLTKNVWAGAAWVFNAHTWDTDRAADPFVSMGQWDMGHIVGGGDSYRPLPWRVCIQAVDQALMFKIWIPYLEGQPSWSDPDHVRVASIPSDFMYAGFSGWYIGHIPPGGMATYSGLGARG